MLKYDWENSVGYWIVNTAHAVRRALNTELAREGITLRQWEVLTCLSLTEELSQAEVAERLGIEAPTLVGILDRMERDGWLERVNCAVDRRKKRIRGTKKAEQLWARMVTCAHRVRARAVSGLNSTDIDALRSICGRIQANLERPFDGPMVTPDASLADTVVDMVPAAILEAARAAQAAQAAVR